MMELHAHLVPALLFLKTHEPFAANVYVVNYGFVLLKHQPLHRGTVFETEVMVH